MQGQPGWKDSQSCLQDNQPSNMASQQDQKDCQSGQKDNQPDQIRCRPS